MGHGSARGARWRRWGATVGGLVVLCAAGVVVADLAGLPYRLPTADLFRDGDAFGRSPAPSPTPPPGADITGPLNILLVGIDSRLSQPAWQPHADAVLVLHVPKALDRGYLFSLPRDLIVEIPAYDVAEFGGGSYRLLSAMTYGARVPGEDLPDTPQGFALLAETVQRYTGVQRFDAGAVLNFPGFADLVDAVGGIEVHLDVPVASAHREPDGTHRALRPGGGGYVGPQRVYEPGANPLEGWEALDIARQRMFSDGDYTRQLHHQRLVKALVREIVDQELMTDPLGLDRVLRAVGEALVFDGRGQEVIDFAFALRGLDPGRIELIGLPGRSVFGNGVYQGEELEPISEEFFAAVRAGQVGAFVDEHPELVNRER